MSGSVLQTADAVIENPWKQCLICHRKQIFNSAGDFKNHLRMAHCSKEGGSFVCQYGRNNVCTSLPVEGVNENDYINHVEKVHIRLSGRATKFKNTDLEKEKTKLDRKDSLPSFAVVKYKDDTLVNTGKKWTQFPAQNLSAVLNDPRRNVREIDFFTRVWGESFVPHAVVPLTLLPNTPKSYFDEHWKKYEFKSMQHERLKRANLAPHTGVKSKESSGELSSETDIIPEIFFQTEFKLEEPAVFNSVLPWSSIQGKSSVGSYKKNSSKLLQEKLSQYLDIVEVKIAQQIATKSDDFFKAMRSQDSLQNEVQVSCQDVKQLRMQLVEMRDHIVKEPLNVMRLFRLRARYEVVEEKLKLMATIHQTQPTIQLLLSSSDFVSALDLIDTSLEVLQQELAGVQCFRHLGSQLVEMQKAIERMMVADFLDFTLTILSQPYTNNSHQINEEERLLSVVLGLLRQRKHNFLQLYKTEAYTVIKSNIKKTAHDAVTSECSETTTDENELLQMTLSSSNSIPEERRIVSDVVDNMLSVMLQYSDCLHTFTRQCPGKKSKVLSRVYRDALRDLVPFVQFKNVKNTHGGVLLLVITKFGDYIRSLEHDEWLMVLEAVFCDVLQILRNMKAIHKGLTDILSLAAGISEKGEDTVFLENDGFLERKDHEKLINESKDLLFGACELAQSRCSKVIIMRSKEPRSESTALCFKRLQNGQLNRLSSKEFVVLARKVETFASDCEDVCGRQSHNLRGTLLSQAKRFIERFHDEKRNKLGNILDIERWKQADVPSEIQVLVDSIQTGFAKDHSKKGRDDSLPAATLVVQGQEFAVVGTLLMLMKMIVEYCQCVDDVPMLTTDILTRLCEILKLFNSRSCQLVLGAGALQTVGLKTITAKHLALVAQCLEDYSNHRHELICKIVNLMEELFRAHLQKYEVRPPMPSKEMRSIVKQIIKLRESLGTVLVGQQIESLCRDIRRCFKNCYAEKLAALNIKCDGGPQHGLVTSDLLFYSSSLKQYSGFADFDNRFDGLWSSVKEIKNKLDEQKYNQLVNKQIETKPKKFPNR